MSRAAVPLVVVLAALLALAPSARADARKDLTVFVSEHYRVFTDLPRAEAAIYGRHMDLIHRSYDRFLRRLEGDVRGLQDIFLLRDRMGYLSALASFGIDGSASGGMFFYGPAGSGLCTWVEGRPRGDVLSTLQHEGFHQFAFRKAAGELPIWVNEGLAEYFGDAVIVEGGVRHGIVDADRLERVRSARARGTAIPLEALLAIGPDTWRQNLTSGSPRGALQYDQAWSVVHFLIHADPKVERAFSDYLTALSRGVPHERAFPAAFGADRAPMEAAYDRFIANLQPDTFGEALSDLRFLAEGLRFLHERDGAAPTDATTLEAALLRARFRVTTTSHGVNRVTRAADAGVFVYVGDDGELAPFTLRPPTTPGLLPEVLASRLRPPVALTWRRDANGELVSDLQFGAP